jgi:hypothetical protein
VKGKTMAKKPGKMTAAEQKRATDAALAKLYAKSPPSKPAAPAAKPSMVDNYKTLGGSMARGLGRMVEQRKVIAEKPAKRK